MCPIVTLQHLYDTRFYWVKTALEEGKKSAQNPNNVPHMVVYQVGYALVDTQYPLSNNRISFGNSTPTPFMHF